MGRKAPTASAQSTNTDTDRYPDLDSVIRYARASEDFPQAPIERFEVTLLASGEGTWRCWAARAEEPIGGYYPNQ